MKKENKRILTYLGIILGIILILDVILVIPNISEVGDVGEKENETLPQMNISMGEVSRVEMKLPAVNQKGEGVATTLVVETIGNGSGRTLTDIENILFWADTQQSIRMARLVAEEMTGVNTEEYDLIYSIDANASVIGGPSAGAAITIATIGALTGRQPNKSVMVTGRINHDGSLGPVSAILEKARASKDVGAKLFLVPLLQSRDVIYQTEKHCEEFGNTEICQSETRPVKIDVANRTGIEVREIGSIKEARDYFF